MNCMYCGVELVRGPSLSGEWLKKERRPYQGCLCCCLANPDSEDLNHYPEPELVTYIRRQEQT